MYPAFAGLPLHFAGTARGYDLLKWLQALAMSLAAVPVYLWGRMLVSRGWALAAAALTLCVPELGLSSFLLTEVLFYPIFCLAAWLMARALLRPTLGRQALVLAAIFLEAMTRLQAIFLAPAFVLAGLLYFGPRGLRRLLPSLAALGVVAAGWIGLTFANGGHVLGAYHVTSSGYRPLEALRFVAYHAADLVLASGVVPAAALVALVVSWLRRRERSREVHAFLAVTVSLVLAVVPVVGVYASEWTGRLAERNLIVLVPLLFLALAVWLSREARWSLDALVGCVFVAALLLITPWGRFVVPAAEPDAFSLVPLVQLRDRLAPYVAVMLIAAALIALLLALPRRLLPLMPLAVGVLLAAASVSAARVSAKQARGYELTMVGSEHRWIDRHALGPVLLLYGGELAWSGGGPVWTNLFWNARVEQVDELFGSRVAGPIPPAAARVDGDGRVVVVGDRRTPLRYVVASRRLQLAGVPLWGSTSQLLWEVALPLRIRTRSGGIDPGSGLLSDPARLDVYNCTGVTVAVGLTAPDARVVKLLRNGRPHESVQLTANTPWSGAIPLIPQRRVCTLTIRGASGAHLDRLDAG